MFEFLVGCAAVIYLLINIKISFAPPTTVCQMCGQKVIVEKVDGGGQYFVNADTGEFHPHMHTDSYTYNVSASN